jgi:hypothetical protein
MTDTFLDPLAFSELLTGDHPRSIDVEIGLALGWRVSNDPWWNWHPGPRFDPPGDAWCIRRDGRNDLPCNEALPRFTPALLRKETTP